MQRSPRILGAEVAKTTSVPRHESSPVPRPAARLLPRGLGLSDPPSHLRTLLDVNNDGNVDQDDVSAVVNIVGGGGCP